MLQVKGGVTGMLQVKEGVTGMLQVKEGEFCWRLFIKVQQTAMCRPWKWLNATSPLSRCWWRFLFGVGRFQDCSNLW